MSETPGENRRRRLAGEIAAASVDPCLETDPVAILSAACRMAIAAITVEWLHQAGQITGTAGGA